MLCLWEETGDSQGFLNKVQNKFPDFYNQTSMYFVIKNLKIEKSLESWGCVINTIECSNCAAGLKIRNFFSAGSFWGCVSSWENQLENLGCTVSSPKGLKEIFDFKEFLNPWEIELLAEHNQDLHHVDGPKLHFKICSCLTI